MALSQDDRIAISKKIISIPLQDAQADRVKEQLEAERIKAEKEDLGNKELMDANTLLINPYQSELERYDGNGRVQLAEQMIVDSSNKTFQNNFFPNDPQTALPSVPSGVWKNFPAFSGSVAVGKSYTETYSSVQKEQDLIDVINAQIVTMESYTSVGRSTGQVCTTGVCSLSQYDNEIDCVNGGGTWVPSLDSITSDTEIQSTNTALKNAVQAWEDFINITHGLVAVVDLDVTRSAENDAARDDITNSISVINAWQALADFDTTHGETTCAGFNSIDVNTLGATKYRAAELQPLKDEITARQAFITTRVAQIVSYLGSVTQDLNTGEIVSADGLYGNRFRFIDMRLNLIGGSLAKTRGFEQGKDAQDRFKQSNANAAAAYASVMVATAFRAPGAGTATIHVIDATGFSVSDTVFIVADKQSEISTTIQSIDGNRIVLTKNIPKKYRENEGARLYKIL